LFDIPYEGPVKVNNNNNYVSKNKELPHQKISRPHKQERDFVENPRNSFWTKIKKNK